MEDVDCYVCRPQFLKPPIKLPKAHKIGTDPQSWPYEYEDVDHWWALEAIRYGNASILARYLREVDEVDPRVCRSLAEILEPTSNQFWRLDVRHRFRGTPTKQAKDLKDTLVPTDVPHLSLVEMLDPDSRHPLRLDFKQRKRGRAPLGPARIDWLPLAPRPPEKDAAMRIARNAKRVRGAKDGGRKVLVKQLCYGTSRATLYRRWKMLTESGIAPASRQRRNPETTRSGTKSANC